MTKKTYICVQSCILNGQRFEEGDKLPFGVEPNQYFKDAETGELVPAPKIEKKDTEITPNVAQEALKGVIIELQKQIESVGQELENVKIGVAGEIDELKAAVVSLCDKVDFLEQEALKSKGETEAQNGQIQTKEQTTDKTAKPNK